MKAQITYLDNSGFAVKTKEHFLVFDCWNMHPEPGKSGLAGGVIDPAEIAGEKVLVFVSHRHGDHYNTGIFKWADSIPDIHYIVSDDVRAPKGALAARAHEEYDIGSVAIQTLRSTDEGVAFLVAADGLKIYHAGDLNWWHWEGEDPRWNAQMGDDYKREVDRLAKERVDIAFVPVDPRLERDQVRGVAYFMETVDAQMVIPMHYGNAAKSAAQALKQAHIRHGERIISPMQRGQTVAFE